MKLADSYPVLRMDDCIDSLGDAAVLTTLGCNYGYWQIPVAPEDGDKTTFTTHMEPFRHLRIPFGLKGAPATIQRELVFPSLRGYRGCTSCPSDGASWSCAVPGM